jgi:hypothetical protein
MEDQILFFNPAKVVRAREHAAALKEVEIQQKRITADKKMQQTIAREEKIRETAEKKVRKETEHIIAREKAAREKIIKAAERKTKKAQKAREMKLHKTEIEKKRTERAQIKKSISQKIKVGKKRSINDNEINKSKKRARIV